MTATRFSLRTTILTGATLTLLAACADGGLDPDLRGLGNGFDTSEASRNLPTRPEPDARGVITYPNNQVVLARRGETVAAIAARLGLDADTLARFNGIDPNAPLRRDELIALPSRVPAGTGTLAAPGTVSVTELASAAIDRAEGTATPAAAPAPAAAAPAAAEPVRHTVRRGETAYSIARLYGVPVRGIADWNGLGPDLAVREGQQLMIPQAGGTAPAPAAAASDTIQTTTIPGTGSPTPLPPSASEPLPDEDPQPVAAAAAEADGTPAPPAPAAPDIGERTASSDSDARLAYPVSGPIIRAYSRGRNEGIDIGAAPGTAVKAAAAGSVAAITEDTSGNSIVVVRHDGNLLTVYVNLADVAVAKDQAVSAGQTLARVPEGDPSYLHFEVRQGLQSVDPTDFLP
ncbi:LysM domain/M23/M37 peptidase [Oceanicola granulosus HTCC2516]|uniref:LysM domain/M23/M37 peptidase n=1 Tax=Oceanicola granulosus (strain ATCC BAA-861 / DSM 15982 / KCTC 12143 / HTCC2516) TaxID=314256 RepID=Q2CAR1_OCEGH|nr:peptidoglycan DD-metalloendopeptidase family protein [Oceanicola granulosus]EAR49777.1 LysM domain/M23/M37 peptidase [Oceanicola granulosus HTCC2516]